MHGDVCIENNCMKALVSSTKQHEIRKALIWLSSKTYRVPPLFIVYLLFQPILLKEFAMKIKLLQSALMTLMCTTFVGVSNPVFADASPDDLARFVKMCDANSDGMVSKAEMMKRVDAAIKAMKMPAGAMIDSKKFMDFLLVRFFQGLSEQVFIQF